MKKLLAKTIYYGAIVLLILASITSIGLLIWFVSDIIGPTGWIIIAIMTAISLVSIGLAQAYWWADKYLKENK